MTGFLATAAPLNCKFTVIKNIPVEGLPAGFHDAKTIAEKNLQLVSKNEDFKIDVYTADYENLNLKFLARHMKEVHNEKKNFIEQNIALEIEDLNKKISLATSRSFPAKEGSHELVVLAYHLEVDSLKYDVYLSCP